MPIPQYNDFEIAIERDANTYRARVLRSPSGEATSKFSLPFSAIEIENLLLRMGQARAKQRSVSQKFDAARTFGSKLYDAVFADEVGKVWQKSLILSDTQNRGLRIRLRLDDAPDLVDIPWELLFDPSQALFINQTVQMPLVRALNLSSPPRALTIKPPLKILVVISAPSDAEELDAAQEWKNLQSALKPLVDAGIILLERLEEANMQALQQKLRRNEYHVLHFIGHGEFDPTSQQSSLLFEDAKQRAWRVNGQVLGTLLYDHKTLRFVYLNACEGALAGSSNPFNGVAQSLLRQGIPAVLAMQFLITDGAALKFSQEVYRALADNYPLDASLSEARKALYLSGNETEWATPVLYLRAPDGVLFDLQGAPPLPPPVAPIPPQKSSASESFDEIYRRARQVQTTGDQIFEETPYENEAWQKQYQEALKLFVQARELNGNDARVPLRLGQVYARLEQKEQARNEFRRVEQLLPEPANDDEKRLIAQALLERALLSDPPNEKLLLRAGEIADAIKDTIILGRIEQAVDRLAHPNANALNEFYGGETPNQNTKPKTQNVGDPNWQPPAANDFDPLGRWNIQVQDMVGSRLYVEFTPNGNFQMMQHVGLYQVPVSGSWSYNSTLQQLEILGVVNTFQPFNLVLTINGRLSDGYSAMGSDGIGYVLMRT